MAPTDGSPGEFPALARAARLAKRFESELHIVRVITPPTFIHPITGPADPELQKRALEDSFSRERRQLAVIARKCRRIGARDVKIALLEGSPAPTLADYAQRETISLIVMSGHVRGGLRRAVMGSVTDYLIRHTETPVFIVRHPVKIVSRDESAIFRIVVPLDGSMLAEEILPQVAAMADNGTTTVNFVQVLTPVTYSQARIMEPALPWWEKEFNESDDYLEHTAAFLRHQGMGVVTDVILATDVAAAIVKHAHENRADLIAIATNGKGGIKRLVFGGIADEVVRSASISVLVFHPGQVRTDLFSLSPSGAGLCLVNGQ